MAFPDGFLEELRNRLPLSGVVSRSVRLLKRGREFTGLCPFHNEKSPSFTVNDDKGFFHCFGCGAHGDVIGFAMRNRGLSFPEAVEQLAAEAGLEVPRMRQEDRERASQVATLEKAVEEAAKWFEAQLKANTGNEARAYIQKRGLKPETVDRFRLGYAPQSRTALKEAMLARGIPEPLLIESGLLIKPEDGGASYDRFRHRVMFPIGDRRGRIIAFGGRALDPDAPAKYLNSPETPLFHKGRNLYNHAIAREAARESGTVIVVEGYMDVIALAQAGFDHTVAPLGTALTEEQLQLLWRMTPEPILCFDGDAAGQRAAYRAADRALPLLEPGRSLRFALLSGGKDPDDFVREFGRASFEEVLSKATNLAEMIWQRAISSHSLDTPEKRAIVVRELKDLTKAIQDPIVRQFYDNEFFVRTGREFFGRNKQKRIAARANPLEASNAFKATSTYVEEKKKLMIDTLIAGVAIGVLINHVHIDEDLLERSLTMEAHRDEINTLRDEIVFSILNNPPGYFQNTTLIRHFEHHMEKFLSVYSRFEGQERNLLPPYARHDAEPIVVSEGIRAAINLYRLSVTLPIELDYAQKALIRIQSSDVVNMDVYNKAQTLVEGIKFEMLALTKLVGGIEIGVAG